MRAILHWRKVGTEKWIQYEETRYICPNCGNKVFRGAVKCNQRKEHSTSLKASQGAVDAMRRVRPFVLQMPDCKADAEPCERLLFFYEQAR